MHDFSAEFERLATNTPEEQLKELRKKGFNAFEGGLNAVDPVNLINNALKWNDDDRNGSDQLLLTVIGYNGSVSQRFSLAMGEYKKVLIIGGGKATAAMAKTAVETIGARIPCYGLINVPHGQDHGNKITSQCDKDEFVSINYAAHPIPDDAGLQGTKKMMEFAENAKDDVFVITMISGGGSALMPYPREPLNLSDLQEVNKILLESGASINEVNAVRKHLSGFKGGNLARSIFPCKSISLIISDVIGDPLDVIASGPTVPDESTFHIANDVIEKYNISDKMPKTALNLIQAGVKGDLEETPKSGDDVFSRNVNLIIGSAEIAKQQMKKILNNQGCISISEFGDGADIPSLTTLSGEAREFGEHLISILKKARKQLQLVSDETENTQDDLESRVCNAYYTLNSGEFTVTIQGNGRGGRNQEMLLGLLSKINKTDLEGIDYAVISMAFDGIEGNSPAAGGVIDSKSLERAKERKLDIAAHLKNNDSYGFFKELDDAVEIGQSGTNTNDICLLLVSPNSKQSWNLADLDK